MLHNYPSTVFFPQLVIHPQMQTIISHPRIRIVSLYNYPTTFPATRHTFTNANDYFPSTHCVASAIPWIESSTSGSRQEQTYGYNDTHMKVVYDIQKCRSKMSSSKHVQYRGPFSKNLSYIHECKNTFTTLVPPSNVPLVLLSPI